MSWDDIMRRMLPPSGGFVPRVTSRYDDTNRPPGSTNPHRAVDFNYYVGPGGQKGINLTHPALRSPVSGIVTKAGGDRYGTIAIKDANGFSHEILHTQAQHVAVGDPIAAGELIGTMGKTGADAYHVHYQLRDPSGKVIDPSAFWDQQGSVDPNPAPPTYLGEQQQYLRDRNAMVNNSFGNVPDAGPIYGPQPVDQGRPLIGLPPRSVDPKSIRVLSGRIAGQPVTPRFNANEAAVLPNEIPAADGPASFSDRFGNWTSSTGATAPLPPYQPISPPPQVQRPLGIVPGKPMPDYPFPPPIFGFSDPSQAPGEEVWTAAAARRLERAGKVKASSHGSGRRASGAMCAPNASFDRRYSCSARAMRLSFSSIAATSRLSASI